MSSHLHAQARRVVSGLDESGRSTVVIDEDTGSRIATPGFTVLDLWRFDTVPAGVADPDPLTGEVVLDPPPHGLVYRINVFPPDSEWDAAAGYSDALDAIGARPGAAAEDHEIPGIHQTDTIDVLTVISGEIYAVLETTEVLLRPGDTFVQRGTKHTWSNRTNEPCTLAVLLVPATR